MEDLKKLMLSMLAKAHLSKANVRATMQINKQLIDDLPKDRCNEIINIELCKNLAQEVLKNYSDKIKTIPISEDIQERSLDLIVLPTSSFKIVIEEIIRLMPEGTIYELRK